MIVFLMICIQSYSIGLVHFKSLAVTFVLGVSLFNPHVYIYVMMKCSLQVDSWYVVLNGCLKFCREQEQEKLLHIGERYETALFV